MKNEMNTNIYEDAEFKNSITKVMFQTFLPGIIITMALMMLMCLK